MIIVKEFDTRSEMVVASIGYHHDHCALLYLGETKNAPDKYDNDTKDLSKKFCLIADEDEPRNIK